MPSEKVDYGPVIADLEAKIITLQGMVATLKGIASGAFVAVALGDGATISTAGAGVPVELPVGALVGKSLPDAIKLYLDAVKKKQTKDQIMTALKEGGFESTSDLGKAISTALSRMKTSKEVLRFPDGGWGLAALYPEAFRARLSEHVAKVSKKGKKRTSQKKASSRKSGEPVARKAANVKSAEAPKGMEQRVQEIIMGSPTRTFQAADLAKTMNVRVQTVGMLLGKLKHKGIIERGGNGYHAPKQTTH